MSGLLQDWLGPVADEVVSCDPTRNALIACAEDSNDQNDARRLEELDRNRSLRPVYIPPEPYRELRSLLVYEERLNVRARGVQPERLQNVLGGAVEVTARIWWRSYSDGRLAASSVASLSQVLS